MVTWLEAQQYALDQPPTGGVPPGGIPVAAGAVAGRPGAPPALPAPAGLSPLPGEGQWQTVVSTPHGDAVRVASVRPDAQHTSFTVGVLWMDPTLVHGVLHPGTEDPGGAWPVPTSIDAAEQRTVVAAFSAGFRLQGDSHGGWYLDGREARPLVPGAASLVLRRDGTTDVGAWGSEVGMSPDVVAVRQNLVPLVDHGRGEPDLRHRRHRGVGLDRRPGRLHQPLRLRGDRDRRRGLRRRAGAVGVHARRDPPLGRAWCAGWSSTSTRPGSRAPTSTRPGGRTPTRFQLFPGEQVGAQHYLQPSSRDFLSFDLRTVADTAGAPPSIRHRASSGRHHTLTDMGCQDVWRAPREPAPRERHR